MQRLLQKKYLRIGFFLVFVPVVTGYLLYRVRIVLLPFFMAVLVAYLLNPPVYWLERKKIPRLPAIILVYAAISVAVAAIVIYGIPAVMDELDQLAGAIPKLIRTTQDFADKIQSRYTRYALPENIRQVLDEKLAGLENMLLILTRKAAGSIIIMFSYLFSLLIAPVFAFYILKDLDNINKGMINFIPKAWRSDILAIFRDVDEIVAKYIRGNLTVAFIVGLLTGLGMYIIGLDFAFTIGFVAGLADLIPYFGPVIAAVPAVSLASLESRTLALYALLVILVVQQLENSIISPKILGESLGLHPLLVIFVLLAGGELYGIIGMLTAVPIVAIVRVILRYIYLKLVD
ncbi:MAG: AI-2E family transporter [Bacillota bacterium]